MRALFFFVLSSGCAQDRGAIEISWNLPAERTEGCGGDPEIATIRASVFAGSLSRTQEIECRIGQTILIPDVPPESYSLVVDALALDDTRLYSQTVTGLQVDEGKTQQQTVDLLPLNGTLSIAWTLPNDCATDLVRDVRLEVWSDQTMVLEDSDELVPCEDGETLLEGSWIVTQDYPLQKLFVFGQDAAGVETHDFAVCDLVVESIVENHVDATLAACPAGPCCTAGDCTDRRTTLCPAE